MIKTYQNISKLILVLSILTSSCTKNFDDINTNPNNPDTASNLSILSYSIVEIGDRFNISEELSYASSYVGHVALGQNNDANRYLLMPPSGMWSSYYVRSLKNLNNIINSTDSNNDVNTIAAAKVLKAYATMIQVDAYGSIPYSEASQLDEEVLNPKYDNEKDIYTDILMLLKEANDEFTVKGFSDNDKATFRKYDLIFGGYKDFNEGILSWKKFANSLRLRLATRISNVDFETAKQHISEIVNNSSTYPIMVSNNDNAVLLYPGKDDWIEPWTDQSKLVPYIYMAAPIVDSLKNLKDPRLAYYAVKVSPRLGYKGLQVGLEGSASRLQNKFISNTIDGKVYFLTYSEVEFLKAEAYSRGLTGSIDASQAKKSYEAAITANMKDLGITNTSHLDKYNNSWDGNEAGIKILYFQKWISLFRQSWEAWAEMRRTDVPELPVAINSPYSGHNRVPFRFGYPDSETQKNSSESTAIVEDFYWGDQIWWDTRKDVK